MKNRYTFLLLLLCHCFLLPAQTVLQPGVIAQEKTFHPIARPLLQYLIDQASQDAVVPVKSRKAVSTRARKA